MSLGPGPTGAWAPSGERIIASVLGALGVWTTLLQFWANEAIRCIAWQRQAEWNDADVAHLKTPTQILRSYGILDTVLTCLPLSGGMFSNAATQHMQTLWCTLPYYTRWVITIVITQQ
jgi:hypothetical protein